MAGGGEQGASRGKKMMTKEASKVSVVGERGEQRDRRVRPIAERGLRRNANPLLALAVRSMDLLLKNVRQKNELQMPD